MIEKILIGFSGLLTILTMPLFGFGILYMLIFMSGLRDVINSKNITKLDGLQGKLKKFNVSVWGIALIVSTAIQSMSFDGYIYNSFFDSTYYLTYGYKPYDEGLLIMCVLPLLLIPIYSYAMKICLFDTLRNNDAWLS